MIEDKDKIPLLLPDSIQMKHYASFKLALKQFSCLYFYVLVLSYILHALLFHHTGCIVTQK